MALSRDVSPTDREIIDAIAERAIRLRAARRDDPFTTMDIVMDLILVRVPVELIQYLPRPAASPAGLTRGSIFFALKFLRKGWIAGSSPAMTAETAGPLSASIRPIFALVHANANPLRLAEFRDAGAYDFAHQIIRIRANLDRENGKLENRFKPRFSAGEGA